METKKLTTFQVSHLFQLILPDCGDERPTKTEQTKNHTPNYRNKRERNDNIFFFFAYLFLSPNFPVCLSARIVSPSCIVSSLDFSPAFSRKKKSTQSVPVQVAKTLWYKTKLVLLLCQRLQKKRDFNSNQDSRNEMQES